MNDSLAGDAAWWDNAISRTSTDDPQTNPNEEINPLKHKLSRSVFRTTDQRAYFRLI